MSNGDSGLDALCEKLRLGAYMPAMAVSALAGCAKPDFSIFENALRDPGVGPGEALHAGDSVEMDWCGADALEGEVAVPFFPSNLIPRAVAATGSALLLLSEKGRSAICKEFREFMHRSG